MFTLIARPRVEPAALTDLPARISESICGYLQQALGLDCAVEPPNDIVASNKRKLCGVLCTSKIVGDRVEYVLCGIGLNTLMTRDLLPLETATSLLVELGDCPAHDVLLDGVLASLEWVVGDAGRFASGHGRR